MQRKLRYVYFLLLELEKYLEETFLFQVAFIKDRTREHVYSQKDIGRKMAK